MSAIFGIIYKDGKHVTEEDLSKLKQAVLHRATDGHAKWLDKKIGLGINELHLYPGQQTGHVCLHDLVIIANAHLHNKNELVRQLAGDASFYSKSDSELILLAFQKWKENCVDYLDGEYVFAIRDKLNDQLFIAKDHIGFKALYYYDTPSQFIFCSEIKGIEAVKQTPNVFDEESVLHNFFFQGDRSATHNKEIKSLPGGCFLKLASHQLTITRYWKLQKHGRYHFSSDETWFECLRDLMTKAIEARLNESVNVGLRLSGGLDSSGVAVILSEILKVKNKSLYTFSSVLPDDYSGASKDEKHYINIIIDQCKNIIPTFVSATDRWPYAKLDVVFEREEYYPYILHYMDTAIGEAAAAKNIQLMYSGFGGDHAVSGHGTGVIYQAICNMKLRLAHQLILERARTTGRSYYWVLKAELWREAGILEKYRKRRSFQLESLFQENFLARHTTSNIKKANLLAQRVNSGATGRMLQMIDNRHEYFGMGAATPLLDRSLLELVIEMPPHLALKNGYRRSHFRHAMRGMLPDEILWRPDKSPYVADCLEKILYQKSEILNYVFDLLTDSYSNRYLNKKQLQKLLLQIESGMLDKRTTKNTWYLFSQVVIFDKVLDILSEKKYIFERH